MRASAACALANVVCPTVFFAAALFSTLAKAGFAGAKLVEATRRVGSEDRARAIAAGVGRVTAIGWSMSTQQPRTQAGSSLPGQPFVPSDHVCAEPSPLTRSFLAASPLQGRGRRQSFQTPSRGEADASHSWHRPGARQTPVIPGTLQGRGRRQSFQAPSRGEADASHSRHRPGRGRRQSFQAPSRGEADARHSRHPPGQGGRESFLAPPGARRNRLRPGWTDEGLPRPAHGERVGVRGSACYPTAIGSRAGSRTRCRCWPV
jgi:hypothetical protein